MNRNTSLKQQLNNHKKAKLYLLDRIHKYIFIIIDTVRKKLSLQKIRRDSLTRHDPLVIRNRLKYLHVGIVRCVEL